MKTRKCIIIDEIADRILKMNLIASGPGRKYN
jgi:hypothetical protein